MGISKIGEEAARLAFSRFAKRVSSPDYLIYGGDQKSWGPDSVVEGVPLAMKCQARGAGRRYGGRSNRPK